MRRYLNYLQYVLRHKFFVLQSGIELGVPLWMLILHDWDKFTPKNFTSYAKCFNTPDGKSQYVETPEFVRGWKSHQQINKHHYQYWIFFDPTDIDDLIMRGDYTGCECHRSNHNKPMTRTVRIRNTNIIVWDRGHAECLDCGKPFPRDLLRCMRMPKVFRKELLADWRGAGAEQGFPDTKNWYLQNHQNIHIDPATRMWIEWELGVSRSELVEVLAVNVH